MRPPPLVCLQFGDLLRRMDGGVKGAVLPSDVARQAVAYAAAVWSECRLAGPAPSSVAYASFARGSGDYLCHFATGPADQFLIVVCAAGDGAVAGCLPLDIGGQYRPVTFQDPSTGFMGEATEAMLAAALPRLLDQGTPAAILDSGPGSYLQTYQTGPDAYDLEYQLATGQFHFAADRVTLRDVTQAFRSYAFGRYEWARDVAWQHRPLPADRSG